MQINRKEVEVLQIMKKGLARGVESEDHVTGYMYIADIYTRDVHSFY